MPMLVGATLGIAFSIGVAVSRSVTQEVADTAANTAYYARAVSAEHRLETCQDKLMELVTTAQECHCTTVAQGEAIW